MQIESKADHIVWGSRDGLLAVSSASGLHLLPETVLHRSKRGKWALVQLASSQVSRATGTPVAPPSERCGAIASVMEMGLTSPCARSVQVHLEHEDGTSHTIETNMRIRGADLHKGEARPLVCVGGWLGERVLTAGRMVGAPPMSLTSQDTLVWIAR